MKTLSFPLVSITTPAYNCQAYLEECIESVLQQTYTNWEYTIINNCSTDNTLAIAQRYARLDKRITIHTTPRYLSQLHNWNHGLRLISPESTYCKILHADDWLYPECVEKMVHVAEMCPHVGIVGAYRLDENFVNLDGLEPHRSQASGREICRRYLLDTLYVFGSPSSLLFRSSIIRQHDPFYEEHNIHADTDICLKVLEDWDFGFVHQVLTYTRRHNESSSAFIDQFDTRRIERMVNLEKYGPKYLGAKELQKRRRQLSLNYHRFLARRFFEFKGLDYWKHHQHELKNAGTSIQWGKLGACICYQLLCPLDTWPHLRKGFAKIQNKSRGKKDAQMLHKLYARK